MKANLTNVHVIRLTKISHRCVNNINFVQFATFDAVRFDELTTIFENVFRDGIDRFALKNENVSSRFESKNASTNFSQAKVNVSRRKFTDVKPEREKNRKCSTRSENRTRKSNQTSSGQQYFKSSLSERRKFCWKQNSKKRSSFTFIFIATHINLVRRIDN